MISDIRVIKKYQNRRLYDTATSSYITLDKIKQIIIDGEAIKVIDAKTDEDVTRSVLLQIILSEEINGVPLFTNDFLINVISLYGKYINYSLSPFLMFGLNLSREMQKEYFNKSIKSNTTAVTGIDFWSELLKNQPSFFENNANLFLQFQDKLNKQTLSVLDYMNFPFKFKEKK